MKKLLVALMAVLFLSSTGMVFAQAGGGSTDKPAKVHKTHKGHKGGKKSKKGAETSAPAAAPAKTK